MVRNPELYLLVATLGVGVLVALPAVGSSWGATEHLVCTVVGTGPTERLWPPVILLNSPFEGSSNGSAVVDRSGTGAESWSVGASNGSSGGLFSLDNWSLETQRTEWTLGPGANSPCSPTWAAVDTSRASGRGAGLELATAALLPPGSPSDRSTPT